MNNNQLKRFLKRPETGGIYTTSQIVNELNLLNEPRLILISFGEEYELVDYFLEELADHPKWGRAKWKFERTEEGWISVFSVVDGGEILNIDRDEMSVTPLL